MFFQTSAATVGMTKNGARTSKRTGDWPKNCWSRRSAIKVPPITVMQSTPPTRTSVFWKALRKRGSVRK